MDNLTPRERELYNYLLGPLSMKEIAFRMNISEGSGKLYSTHVYSKLGADRIVLMAREIERLTKSLADPAAHKPL